jgi:hypothetical protein
VHLLSDLRLGSDCAPNPDLVHHSNESLTERIPSVLNGKIPTWIHDAWDSNSIDCVGVNLAKDFLTINEEGQSGVVFDPSNMLPLVEAGLNVGVIPPPLAGGPHHGPAMSSIRTHAE